MHTDALCLVQHLFCFYNLFLCFRAQRLQEWIGSVGVVFKIGHSVVTMPWLSHLSVSCSLFQKEIVSVHVSLSVRVALLALFFDDELASFVVYCSPKYNEKRLQPQCSLVEHIDAPNAKPARLQPEMT